MSELPEHKSPFSIEDQREAKTQARNLFVNGDFEKAGKAFRALIDVDPGWAWNGLGGIEERQKNWSEAKTCYLHAIEFSPNEINFHLRLYHMYRQLGEMPASTAVIGTITEHWPDNPAALHIEAYDDLINSRLPDARKKLQVACEKFPENTNLLRLASIVAERLGFLKEACEKQEQLVEMIPDDISERLKLIKFLRRLDDQENVENQVSWFQENAPDNHDFLMWQKEELRSQSTRMYAQALVYDVYTALFPFLDDATKSGLDIKSIKDNVKTEKDVWKPLLNKLSNDETIRLLGGDFHFVSASDIPVLLTEILVDEDYYFETQNDAPYIIDCGANIGLGIYYHKRRFPKSTILAFEPGRRTFKILSKNAETMNWSNVELLPYAISDCEAELSFFDPDTMPMAGSLTNRMTDRNFDGASYIVETKKLSSYIDRQVDFLKLDIEGAELPVLREVRSKLNFVKFLFCEVHFNYKGDMTYDPLREILQILEECNFDILITPAAINRTGTKRTFRSVGSRTSLNLWAKNRSVS
nr:FkbM family methyltransferase [uncultured Cohaesibacter sp.]